MRGRTRIHGPYTVTPAKMGRTRSKSDALAEESIRITTPATGLSCADAHPDHAGSGHGKRIATSVSPIATPVRTHGHWP